VQKEMNESTDNYSYLTEISEIIDSISLMKDKTLDHFYENELLATKLMLDLNELEEEAQLLIKEFDF
jgi:hypothetical protein